jgi:iron complex transport system ATP-binding protein
MRFIVSTPVLEIHNLSLSIGGKEILRDISFSVPKGVHLAIVGPNGAGKTSLLKCLMRIRTDWQGDVMVEGRRVTGMPQRDLARMVGYVPQADGRLVPYTVSQFVLMSRYPHLSPFSTAGVQDYQAVKDALKVTGTETFADRDIRTLSGGERQKVFIAGALAQGAHIMLLDEPTTFLDPMHESQVLDLLDKLRCDYGTTILSVTHDVNHAALYGDRVMAMVDGRAAFDGLPGDFMDNRVLESVYGRTFTFIFHPSSGKPVVIPEGPGR